MGDDRVARVQQGRVEKGVFDNRGKFQPKAPPNLVLPKPVAVPPAPTQNSQNSPKK